jgi:hypothetical protein
VQIWLLHSLLQIAKKSLQEMPNDTAILASITGLDCEGDLGFKLAVWIRLRNVGFAINTYGKRGLRETGNAISRLSDLQ